MRITGKEQTRDILKEIGGRLKEYRLASDISQSELAQECNLSVSTIVRLEQGNDLRFSNYITVLDALGLIQNLDFLVPEPQKDFEILYEKQKTKQRASKINIKTKTPGKWVWGDEK